MQIFVGHWRFCLIFNIGGNEPRPRFFQVSKLSEDQKNKGLHQKWNTFFPKFNWTCAQMHTGVKLWEGYRCRPYSNYWKGYNQIIGGYIPPSPPGFRHPWFSRQNKNLLGKSSSESGAYSPCMQGMHCVHCMPSHLAIGGPDPAPRGGIPGPCPPNWLLVPPKRKTAPPSEDCPEEINRLGASGAQFKAQISVFCGLTPDFVTFLGWRPFFWKSPVFGRKNRLKFRFWPWNFLLLNLFIWSRVG